MGFLRGVARGAGLAVLLVFTCAGDGPRPRYAGRSIPRGVRVDRLRVHKGRHRLEAWSGEQLLKIYTVAIGRGGSGHKRREGDGRTPEGRYTIDSRHRSRRFHLFLHISYPSAQDRAAFRAAVGAGKLPRDARVGGNIGIHGERRGWSWLPHKWIDWTRGCIAVDDDEIEELYRVVVRGATVEIVP